MTVYPQATARAALWTAATALVLRLLYFAEHAESAFFGVAILDEAYYDGAARALVEGDPSVALGDGFRPPLYPMVLAALYRLGSMLGNGLEPATAIAGQHMLGVATTILVTLLAARLSDRASVGALAGLLYGVAGPPLFFEGERLIVSLFTFLITASLVLAGSAAARPRRWQTWLLLAVAIGLAAQARANGLLLALPFFFAVAVLPPRTERRHAVGAATVGLLAVVLSFALVRVIAGGGFHLLPSAGGVNLYLGNERGADGMVPRQDRPVTYGEAYRDSVAVFAEQAYERALGQGQVTGAATPQRISRYWMGRALAEVAADPIGRLRLLGKKAALLLANTEIPNNKRYSFITEQESPLLASLPVRWWLLLAFAPLGVVAVWRRGDRALLVWTLTSLAVLAAGIVLFFVNGRFRIPLWPVMACFAASGVVFLGDALAAKKARRIAAAAGTVAVLATLSFTIGRDLSVPGIGRDEFFRSMAYLEKGQLKDALTDAQRAVALMPEDGAAWMQLGNVHQAADRPEPALEGFRRAEQLRPDEPRIANNIGVVLERLERPGEAFRSYQRAIRLEPTFPPPWVNSALLELRAGRIDRAAQRLARARNLGFQTAQRTAAEVVVLEARGEYRQARALRDNAPPDERRLIDRIIEDIRRPLDPTLLDEQPPMPADGSQRRR